MRLINQCVARTVRVLVLHSYAVYYEYCTGTVGTVPTRTRTGPSFRCLFCRYTYRYSYCTSTGHSLPEERIGEDRYVLLGQALLQITLDPVARGSIPRGGGVFPGYPGDLPEDSTVYQCRVSRLTKVHASYRIPLYGPAAQPLGHRAEAL